MRKLILFAVIFVFFMLSAGDVFACKCKPLITKESQGLNEEIKTAYQKSTAVFYGKVIEIIPIAKGFFVRVKIKVEKSWKDQAESEIIIHTGRGGGDCGYRFKVGKKYLIYAYGDKNSLQTNDCQRTSTSGADSKYLDKLAKPKLFSKN